MTDTPERPKFPPFYHPERYIPRTDYVLVERDILPQTTEDGLFTGKREALYSGIVVGVGADVTDIPLHAHVKWSPSTQMYPIEPGSSLLCVKASGIFAVAEGAPDDERK